MLVISLGWLSSLMMRWGIWNVFRLGSVSLRGCVIRLGPLWGTPRKFSGGANEPGGSSSGVVQGVRVRRNPAGKITRVEDLVKGSWCEYAYDASGRLIRAVSSDDVSVAWVYDPVGLLMREETHQEGALVRVRAFSYEGGAGTDGTPV